MKVKAKLEILSFVVPTRLSTKSMLLWKLINSVEEKGLSETVKDSTEICSVLTPSLRF